MGGEGGGENRVFLARRLGKWLRVTAMSRNGSRVDGALWIGTGCLTGMFCLAFINKIL